MSVLDSWTQAQFQKDAVSLNDSQMSELVGYVLKLADSDVKFWSARNDRMMESQRFWEMAQSDRSVVSNQLVAEVTREEPLNDGSETVVLNDGYLIVDKITSMISGAGWGIDVPPRTNETEDAAQRIEDLLYWAESELNAQHGLALNGTLIRDEAHYAVLRGWICGLIVPNLDNPEVPWTYLLEDPLLVYPRYGRSGLIRVTHRYDLTVIEAREEFPQAVDFFIDRDDDGTIEITTYYDEKYKMVVLSGEGFTQRAGDRVIIQPLVEHGYVDFKDRPINPWIIVTPRGTPVRKSEAGRFGDSKSITRLIGLDVLHPIKEIIRRLEKLASQLHTEIAKGINPSRIIYYDGTTPPEELDFGVGATNFLVMGAQEAKILETSAMRPDTGPFLELLTDRLQRGSVPSVLYGGGTASLSGYAISLLSQGARDVVGPLLEGIKLFRQLRFRRMLEMYVNFGSEVAPELFIPSVDQQTDRVYMGVSSVKVEDIRNNGVFVDVTYEDITPQDKVQMLTAAIGGLNSGILSPYDIHKDWLKTRNPRAAVRRAVEAQNYRDPAIMREMSMLLAEKSGDELLKEAVRLARIRQLAEQNLQAQSTKDPTVNVNSQAVPPNMQPGSPSTPANIDPLTAVLNQLQNTGAAQSGGSFPEV